MIPPMLRTYVVLVLMLGLMPFANQRARGAERLFVEPSLPRNSNLFTVSPDGDRLYFAGRRYLVVDENGKLLDEIGVPQASFPRMLFPLGDGFLACNTYQRGFLGLCRADGSVSKVLVGKGKKPELLRSDGTGWTSPQGAAVDVEKRLIFVLDETNAPAGKPTPDWSRIVVYDFNGQFVRDIRHYDAASERPDEALRVWYDDIEVDPQRGRIYLTTRTPGHLLALDYQGKKLGEWSFPGADRNSLAVLPDGRVAVGWYETIQILDRSLKPIKSIQLDPARRLGFLQELETDKFGRLYASTNGRQVTFLRWEPNLESFEVVGPRFLRLEVQPPEGPITGSKLFRLRAHVEGTLAEPGSGWQVFARGSDGVDPRWHPLPCRADQGSLTVSRPPGLAGSYVLCVRFGRGPVDVLQPRDDPSLELPVLFAPENVHTSVSIVSATGRLSFRQGEGIPLQLVPQGNQGRPVRVSLTLSREGRVIGRQTFDFSTELALNLPSGLTERLSPGEYRLEPSVKGMEGYPLALTIAAAEPDSPLQRILYHEFRQVLEERGKLPPSNVDQKAFYRDYVRSVSGARVHAGDGPAIEGTGELEFELLEPGPAARPDGADRSGVATDRDVSEDRAGSGLDHRVLSRPRHAAGLRYDTQILPHCGAVPFREELVDRLVPVLQRAALRLGRYPSFYGFNYHDELFFKGGGGWSKQDADSIALIQARKFPGRPVADAYLMALGTMYQQFNAAVRLADPQARITATPMWQFPAMEGSYAPLVYDGMSESYTHFLSEGYDVPWYPAHSVEFLRRPNLPVMGVFDYHKGLGAGYAKNFMQVLARGVQGAGVEHAEVHAIPLESETYRLTNDLARWYGPIFAEAPPVNEAAVLYSYTQDVSETRHFLGTPHWERVYCMVGAGLMAGVPMSIVYEEDVAAGGLLENGRPKVGMLFLAGQTKPLPDGVRRALGDFEKAGGTIYRDADSSKAAGGTELAIHPGNAVKSITQGQNSDAWYMSMFPELEALAKELRQAVGDRRRFPLDTDDPWVSKNLFDGGQIRYVMLASETSPISLDPGTYWTLGGLFYDRNVFPKTVKLSMPKASGVVYDVFEQAVIEPVVEGAKSVLPVDLSLYPGRLYAVVPERLGPPKFKARVEGTKLVYRVQVEDAKGQALKARVPLRIRLIQGESTVLEQARGTDANGVWAATIALPIGSEPCRLEVTELLGGAGASLTIAASKPAGPLVTARSAVDLERPRLVRDLLDQASETKTIALIGGSLLEPGARAELTKALQTRGITVRPIETLPETPAPGVVMAMGTIETMAKNAGPRDRDPLQLGYDRGLFRSLLCEQIPGPGRGVLTAYLAPRGRGEHVIALVGGDTKGLAQVFQRFVGSLSEGKSKTAVAARGTEKGEWTLVSAPIKTTLPVRLRERVGVPLSEVKVSEDGKHLVVSSKGFHRNLALVEDRGGEAAVVQAERVGGSSEVKSLYVSADGRRFGASGRFLDRFGEAFLLFDRSKGAVSPEAFTAFGHDELRFHEFACDESGNVVLATGSHGVVCWERGQGEEWKERWAIDFYQEFAKLEWPISGDDERIPSFHALIPAGSDLAYILYSEKVDNGWVTPGNSGGGWLAAYRLADGQEVWKYDLNDRNALMFPRIVSSPTGSSVALVIQDGSWDRKSYRMEVVEKGQKRASWTYTGKPEAVALSDRGGLLACSESGQGLDMHDSEGTLLLSMRWPSQPNSLAFNSEASHLLVADDLCGLTCLDLHGRTVWTRRIPSVSSLAVKGERIYAAGADGRLRAFSERDGRPLWTLDLTDSLQLSQANAAWTTAPAVPERVISPRRAPTTSTSVPKGPNLLDQKGVQVKAFGTSGWASSGSVQVAPKELNDGRIGGLSQPWLSRSEQFWSAYAGRQVGIEVDLPKPTHIHSITIHEDPKHPEAWPSDGLVQVYDEARKEWRSVAWGAFLNGPTNTYPVDLPDAQRIRYLPWTSYGRNFYTSEIEVR